MSKHGRWIVVLLLMAVSFAFAAPAAFAVVDVVAQADVPAIETPEPLPDNELPSWTYRYLIPTLLVGTVLVIVLTIVLYFVKVVGKRYRVVQ